jgi:hypothetical protein
VVIHRGLVAGLHARPRTPASTWMQAWLRQRELDRQLAEGGNPTTNALCALRARQLTRRSHRRGLATGIRRLVAEACDPPLLRRPPVPPLNRQAVQAARGPLLRLASRLVESENPCPRAVALASYLVCDPDSPAYTAATGATVADVAETALTAIDHQPLR